MLLGYTYTKVLCLISHTKSEEETIIWSVVLCGCVTGSVILREEHGEKVFKDRILSRIFWTVRR